MLLGQFRNFLEAATLIVLLSLFRAFLVEVRLIGDPFASRSYRDRKGRELEGRVLAGVVLVEVVGVDEGLGCWA